MTTARLAGADGDAARGDPVTPARCATTAHWVQFALAEPTLNPLGLGTSAGLMQTLATPLGTTMIRSNDAQATAGTLWHNLGVAVGFD